MKNKNHIDFHHRQEVEKIKAIDGSITVEAAFVMPIVMFTIFALIYLAFYLHDINQIRGATDLTIHKAGITVKHEADIVTGKVNYEKIGDRGVFYLFFGSTEEEEKQIRKYLDQKLSKGLFLTKVSNITVEVGKFNVTVSVVTETKVSLPGIKHLFDPFSNTIITGEYPVHNPAETLRFTEVILETGSSIKGVDKLKEKLDDIFGSEE